MPALAVENMLDLIGGTPIVRLRHLVDASMADVFCKCEQFNPGGSLKDRIALSMIEAAEREGRIRPRESVIVEPTSGNTGVGLAVVAAAKGYKLILTMPDNMSLERRALLRAYGAEVHLTPAAQVMKGAVERAQEICRNNPRRVHADAVPEPGQRRRPPAHDRARRSWPSSATGCPTRSSTASARAAPSPASARCCARSAPDVRIVAVEPEKSAVLSGGPAGEHRIDGIGAGFVPAILDRSVLTEVRTISERDAQRMKLQLALREGLLVGISAGASVKIALDVARELGPGKTVVTILCDTGERYFSSDAYFE